MRDVGRRAKVTIEGSVVCRGGEIYCVHGEEKKNVGIL